tara:strand:- start:128359 stop:128997 length:639 start_codon:yes stop_codon:yes gene_type:complete
MSSLDTIQYNAKRRAISKFEATPRNLTNQYIGIAEPHSYNRSEAEFFDVEARYAASHITKGFASKNEFKDDLKALIIKPALLTFEAGYHGVRFVLKLLEVLAHLLTALIEMIPQEPEESKYPMLSKLNLFNRNPTALIIPEQDLANAADAAVDAAESLVKLIVYPIVANIEFYAQCGSFIAKCVFSIDDKMEERFDAAKKGVQAAIPAFASA